MIAVLAAFWLASSTWRMRMAAWSSSSGSSGWNAARFPLTRYPIFARIMSGRGVSGRVPADRLEREEELSVTVAGLEGFPLPVALGMAR